MKFIKYQQTNECSDDTKEDHLAKQINKAFKITNEILEECAKEKIKVVFDIVPIFDIKQNNKIKLKKIYKDLTNI